MTKFLFYWILFASASMVSGQSKKETRNLIIVTLDGFRWQEVFRGGSPLLLANKKYVLDEHTVKDFSGIDGLERRNKLLPFFWNTIAQEGQLYGNRDLSNYLNCSNPYWFSYPGYHELLVGAVNKKVCSNLKIENPNITVLEFLNTQSDYKNSVAAFATWDVFPYILGERCSGIPVNAGVETISHVRLLSQAETRMNARLTQTGNRSDSITFHLAFEHLKIERPKVLYIALDETDHFAHKDRYDLYLSAAHQTDQWLQNLWRWIQSDPEYKDNTTLVITTDHGRGQNSKKTWRHHGRLTFGSGQIWLAAIGPDILPSGEIKTHEQLYQKQIASTIANLLGFTYINSLPVGSKIESLMMTPALLAKESKRNSLYGSIR